ncbi:MAG: lipocalin-like domain-containing protein [Deltaproteobacteria bacterium]|nr:MAG: lipocalin-like domain-containing protein [Deltaproteobacteria bacterium]
MADIAQIVGTWKLKSIEDPHPDVEVQDFNPTGYTTYDSTGHMSNQIARRSDRPKFASDDPAKGTAEEIRAASSGTEPTSALTKSMRKKGSSFIMWKEPFSPIMLVGITYAIVRFLAIA